MQSNIENNMNFLRKFGLYYFCQQKHYYIGTVNDFDFIKKSRNFLIIRHASSNSSFMKASIHEIFINVCCFFFFTSFK
jgi:hypothetical protein